MKNFFTCVLLLLTTQLFSQVQGPLRGAKFISQSFPGSSQSWNVPDNAGNSDNNYSDCSSLPNVGNFTDYLVATDFGFSIPSGTIINGILVEVERSDPNGHTSEYSVRIIKGNTIGTSDRATGAAFPLTDDYAFYGSPGDLWGETWNSEDINDNGFGIAIAAQKSSNGSTKGEIDDIRITVYYSFSTLPVTLLNFSGNKNGNLVDLKWTTTNESNIRHYEVERSVNGRDFEFLSKVSSRNQQSKTNYYSRDYNPAQGMNYYRLKMTGTGGDITYSRIISVQPGSSNAVMIYPNPWKKGEPLYINNPNREELIIYFVNESGQTLGTTKTSNSNLNTTTPAYYNGSLNYKIINRMGQKIGSGRLLLK